MAVGYRAILRLDDDEDALHLAEEQLKSWLLSKTHPRRNATLHSAEWEGAGEHHLGKKSLLRVVDGAEREDHTRRCLYRLEEGTSAGTFVVSMFAISSPSATPGQRQSLVVEAEKLQTDRDEAISSISTPRLVRSILERAPAHDGLARLAGSPTVVSPDDVGELLAVIKDSTRISPIIVGASIATEADAKWMRLLANLTRESTGVAAVYALNAGAVEPLNRLMPGSHQVLRGRVRTFLPHVDLAATDDGLRHRFLGPNTLANNIVDKDRLSVHQALAFTHAESARRRLIELQIPADIRRSMEILTAEELRLSRKVRTNEALREVSLSRPTASSDGDLGPLPSSAETTTGTVITAPHEQRRGEDSPPSDDARSESARFMSRLQHLMGRLLGRKPEGDLLQEVEDAITRSAVEAEIAAQQADELLDKAAALEQENFELKAQLQDVELEAAIEAEEALDASRRAAYYRDALRGAQRFDALVVPEDDAGWLAPESVQEMIETLVSGNHRIRRFVVFTGDRGAVNEVDKRDQVGRYARTFWDYARVLHDYAKARESGYQGNVHMYLSDDDAPAGHKCSPHRHASTESDSTQQQWADERLFPIPPEVAEGRRVLMLAHFKPTHDSQFAPRMHYFDDTAKSGKIYIGYIGRHLTNTIT